MNGGAEGWGLMTTEHFEPQSVDRTQANSYYNCYLACRRCNCARKALAKIGDGGARLLDPCRDSWAEHFAADGSSLLPREEDGDAAYTHRVYDLDDPCKTQLRRLRREHIDGHLDELSRYGKRVADLLRVAQRLARKGDDVSLAGAKELVNAAHELESRMQRARQELERAHAPVPIDADRTCRCGHSFHHSLPSFIADELVELP